MHENHTVFFSICFILSLATPHQLFAEDWSIGIYEGTSPLVLQPSAYTKNPVLTAQDVTDIQADFLADPFLLQEGDAWYLFFEALNSANSQGDIGYASSANGYDWTYQKIVFDEPFHLSYPQVFKWEGEYYMVPETSETNSIRLYRAVNFPSDWEFVTTLVSGRPYVDSSLFYYNGGWWMYSAAYSSATGVDDTLYLFYADNLVGPWVEHPMSPVVAADPNIARPGGRVIQFDNRLVRFTQDDYPTYGNQVRAFEVMQLTRTDYAEVEVPENPVVAATGLAWNADGMHHIDPVLLPSGTWLAVVDGKGDPQLFESISKTDWTLVAVDSEELVGEDGAATNAFDGATESIWHTQWLGTSPPHPHWLEIDLGTAYDLDGFGYLARQDGGVNGRVKDYAFYVSADGMNWGSPVAAGAFPNTALEQQVSFATTEGRYVRFEGLSEQTGGPYTSMAELVVLGLASETSPTDSDGDGIVDSFDQCPNTPAGAAVDVNGCTASQLDSDSDNDGVSDAVDLCPGTMLGSIVDTNGCAASQLDSDNDGVSDALDLCPVTLTGSAVDANGCAVSQIDSNGDGISDLDAIALGLDPSDPDGDSDGDGVSDVVEIGGDLSNPRDSNTDGVIDALEAMIASGLQLLNYTVVDTITAAGEQLSGVSATAVTGGATGISFPFGAVSYTTTSLPGGTVLVMMMFSVDLPANLALYKVDNAVLTELPTIAWRRVDARMLEIALTDGDLLTDLDGSVDGAIVNTFALGVVASAPVAGATGGGGGCALNPAGTVEDPTLLLIGLIALIICRPSKMNSLVNDLPVMFYLVHGES